VMGFAFCSGYGHMKLSEQQGYYTRRLKSLISLLVNYWIIIAVFSVISILCGQRNSMPGDFKTVLGNVFLYRVTYNGAWWYMWAYVLLVLISPVLLNAVKKLHPMIIFIGGLMIYILAYYVRFKVSTDNFFLQRFGPFGMTVTEYLMGCVWYQKKLFSVTYHRLWERFNLPIRLMVALVLFMGMLYGHTRIVRSLFIAPITGISIITLFHFSNKPIKVQQFFLFIGKHSTNIWLTHMFFYLMLFENLVYIARFPILVYMLMIVITVLLSMVLKTLERPFLKKLCKRGFIF
jgi:hypothetical protein